MRILIDLGAYDGDSLIALEYWKFDKVYAFEPNPRFKEDLEKLDVEFSNKVAWIEDGTVMFSVDGNDLAYGSTVMKSKATYNNRTATEMKSFDFSEWLKQFRNDDVTVKMDIEGAEFPILNKMIKDGTDEIVKDLHVEFHANKVREYTTTDVHALIKNLKCKVHIWH